MTVLFHVTLMTMLRHFEGVLLALAEKGHRIRVAMPNRRPDLVPPATLAGHSAISFVRAPPCRGDAWGHPIHEMRALRDYLRYLDSRYDHAPKLRTRALRKMVAALTHEHHSHIAMHCPHCNVRMVDDQVGRMLLAFRKEGRRNLSAMLALMESTIPSDANIDAFIRAEAPDVVLVTPLINFGSYQADFVKSAQALNIPVGFPVFSWDNLTNKGLIHVVPDRVFVWNSRQRYEAVKMHGVPAERVVVTGAPRFDDFFRMQPQPREAFCAAAGLDPAKPIVTYLCSSEFVAQREVDFVGRWINDLRSDPALRDCGVLIRPHPREQKQWRSFTPPPGVAVVFPLALNADQTLFDTLVHSAAVVGLNTSAQLEAGIVGRPVFTILAPAEVAEGQQGTIHFQYLLKEKGGFVEVAPDFQTHRRQLAAALRGEYDAAGIRTFIESFLRPHGLSHPATPFMVSAIEELAHTRRPELHDAVRV